MLQQVCSPACCRPGTVLFGCLCLQTAFRSTQLNKAGKSCHVASLVIRCLCWLQRTTARCTSLCRCLHPRQVVMNYALSRKRYAEHCSLSALGICTALSTLSMPNAVQIFALLARLLGLHSVKAELVEHCSLDMCQHAQGAYCCADLCTTRQAAGVILYQGRA